MTSHSKTPNLRTAAEVAADCLESWARSHGVDGTTTKIAADLRAALSAPAVLTPEPPPDAVIAAWNATVGAAVDRWATLTVVERWYFVEAFTRRLSALSVQPEARLTWDGYALKLGPFSIGLAYPHEGEWVGRIHSEILPGMATESEARAAVESRARALLNGDVK